MAGCFTKCSQLSVLSASIRAKSGISRAISGAAIVILLLLLPGAPFVTPVPR